LDDKTAYLFTDMCHTRHWLYLLQSINHTQTHTIVLWLFWILSETTWVSWYQKGKTNLDLLEQEIVSGSGICGLYANMHLTPDRTMPTSNHLVFYRPFLPPNQQRQSMVFVFCSINCWISYRTNI